MFTHFLVWDVGGQGQVSLIFIEIRHSHGQGWNNRDCGVKQFPLLFAISYFYSIVFSFLRREEEDYEELEWNIIFTILVYEQSQARLKDRRRWDEVPDDL